MGWFEFVRSSILFGDLRGNEQVENVLREIVVFLPLLLFRELDCDEKIALVGLAVELVGDGMQTRIFAGMALSIPLEVLVGGFQRLLREKTERQR